MAFRDDDVARRERARALEVELAQLREENLALRRMAARGRTRKIPLVAGALGIVLLAGAAYSNWGISGSLGETIAVVLTGLAVLAMAVATMAMLLAELLIVVAPNRIVVVSGRMHRAPDGSMRGYRALRGGRLLRIPFVEQAQELAAGPFVIEQQLADVAVRRGSVSLSYSARARVDDGRLHEAVEGFLGKSEEEIASSIARSLEGSIRGVAAVMTAEELHQERLSAASRMMMEADDHLHRAGIKLEELHLLTVEPHQ